MRKFLVSDAAPFTKVHFGDTPDTATNTPISELTKLLDSDVEAVVYLVSSNCGCVYWPSCTHLYPFHMC